MTVKYININDKYDEEMQNKRLEKDKNIVREINIDNMKKKFDVFIYRLDKLKNLSNSIALEIENGNTKNINYLLSETEKCLLESKHLDVFSHDLEDKILDVNDYNSLLIEGKTHGIISELHVEKNDVFTYVLPEMLGKRGETKGTYRGVFIGNITTRLTLEHLKTIGYKFNKMEKALVVFEHHIDSNNDINYYTDPDNIDAKKALDGINGLIIEDDTIRNINLAHVTIHDDKAFTLMHVIRQNQIETWLNNNIDLFTKM